MLTQLTLAIVLAPLISGVLTGIVGKKLGRGFAHSLTILGVAVSFVLSLMVLNQLSSNNFAPVNQNIYTWGVSGSFSFYIGFMIDRLSAVMMATVSFISLMVHIYSMGYMKDDPGYERFFSYISLFTFAMLMLVSANNFLQLYFGWEGVGLVSYLLIGFWFKKETANFGALKAFLVNRIGDFGFLLGIAAILNYTNTLDIAQVFTQAATVPPHMITVICLLLFMGAMGKSAQMPLHIWLPESMEGPTPISALIHAATMVTAGIYLVARLSPLYQLSPTALSVIMIIGATGALLLGILALVQFDIKRVVAYSTLSQLGYMVAALGASAYSAGIFHLVTHAFFKALLFLAAGSVIIALHHEQDMRRMGGLKKYMPLTYYTFFIGALALSAIPPFAGFFSKDAIVDAILNSTIFGSKYAYVCVVLGAFVTPLYIFRALFMTFHGEEKFSDEKRAHLHESSFVVTFPLVLLAIPSVLAGCFLLKPLIIENWLQLGTSTVHYDNAIGMILLSMHDSAALYFSIGGVFAAYLFYRAFPKWPHTLKTRLHLIYTVLIYKYGFDLLNEKVIMPLTRSLANVFFIVGDVKLVDDIFVNGSGRVISKMSEISRKIQSGYLYHYALLMIAGLLVLLAWMMLR